MTALLPHMTKFTQSLSLSLPPRLTGRVSQFDGQMISCDGFPASIATLCSVAIDGGGVAYDSGQSCDAQLQQHVQEAGAQGKEDMTTSSLLDALGDKGFSREILEAKRDPDCDVTFAGYRTGD